MRKNKLREMMRAGKPTIGTRVINVWPGLAEVIGHTGISDYVEFVSECAPWDLHDLEHFARAVELSDMSSMMKVDQEPRGFIAQRALGAGFQNILFSDIRSVEDAEECVRIVRPETPEGKGTNGCHNRRNVGYVVDVGSAGYLKAMNDSVVAIMIEKKGAMDNIEATLSVKGVDMVQFGCCDYSLSVGLAGQWSHKKVEKAKIEIIKVALKMGVHPRVEVDNIHTGTEDIKKYIDLGVRDFSLPNNVDILYQWLRKNGNDVRKILSKI